MSEEASSPGPTKLVLSGTDRDDSATDLMNSLFNRTPRAYSETSAREISLISLAKEEAQLAGQEISLKNEED